MNRANLEAANLRCASLETDKQTMANTFALARRRVLTNGPQWRNGAAIARWTAQEASYILEEQGHQVELQWDESGGTITVDGRVYRIGTTQYGAHLLD